MELAGSLHDKIFFRLDSTISHVGTKSSVMLFISVINIAAERLHNSATYIRVALLANKHVRGGGTLPPVGRATPLLTKGFEGSRFLFT